MASCAGCGCDIPVRSAFNYEVPHDCECHAEHQEHLDYIRLWKLKMKIDSLDWDNIQEAVDTSNIFHDFNFKVNLSHELDDFRQMLKEYKEDTKK